MVWTLDVMDIFVNKIRQFTCLAIIITAMLAPAPVSALFEFGTTPNPVGSGARALGMGGAFIAVADDATAASWNPGGLTELETSEISVVGAWFDRNENFVYDDPFTTSGEFDISNTNINYLSAAMPLRLFNRHVVVSVNYQNLFDLTKEFSYPLHTSVGSVSYALDPVNFTQEGQIYAIGLAGAIQLTPSLSFGMTLNFWEDGLEKNQWDRHTYTSGPGLIGGVIPLTYTYDDRHTYQFKGFNINLGLLWRFNEKITVGAVVKTPFSADLSHRYSTTSRLEIPSLNYDDTTYSSGESDEQLDIPLSYGIGIAYRFSDSLSMAIDLYRTEWDDFIHTDSTGEKRAFTSGIAKDASTIKPTTQIRMGGEYLIIKPKYVVPLRAGLFYDPAPAEGSPDEYYGFSLGSGIGWGRFIFDIAYQLRWGNDVGKDLILDVDSSQDILENTIYTSLIIHF